MTTIARPSMTAARKLLLSFLPVTMLSSLAAGAQPKETTLHPLNDIDRITATYLTKPPRRLEVVRDTDRPGADEKAILFGGHAPTAEGSKYFGIMVPLAEPVDLRKRAVRFDARTPTPESTKALYVRLYNRGETKPAWSFHSWNGQLKDEWRTFTLQRGLCLDGLSWERHRVGDRTGKEIDRIEFIIGTRDNDVDVLAVVDDLRMASRKPTIQELTQPKRLVRETRVVDDGEPVAVVLHPDSQEGRAAAATIVASVTDRTGVTLPSRVGTEQDRRPAQTAVLIGSIHTNPAMLLLYARYMTPVDDVCPGTGGALVHTVFDPFGKGVNAVVVGASDAAGMEKATTMLADVIKGQPKEERLVLPRLFERAYGADFLKQRGWADDEPAADRLEQGLARGRSVLERGRHTSIAGVLRSVAHRYQITGHGVEAKLFVRLWQMYAKSAVADPRKFGGPWGFDSDFPSSLVVAGWRNIEYDPGLTDEERLATVKAMGRWLSEAVVPSCVGAVGSRHVPHNHQTFPALGTLFAGFYFTEGFDVAEGRRWLGIADAIFRRQAGYYKPYEDCNGYQWLTNGHLMRYTVARPDFTLYENGNARRIIDYCLGTMDNLGYQVPYGDTGSWKCWDTETVCLDTFAFVTGDRAAAWAADLKQRVKNTKALYAFQDAQADLPVPRDYNGVKAWPLEPQYYHTHRATERPPLERCFDKISFRKRMDPAAEYLLLDGLSNGGHKHYDGQSVPRLTQFNRIWLTDNDYYKSAVKYHNSMMVIRDGESERIPAYVELLGAGETRRYGFSRTLVRGYADADWYRTIVWLKTRKAFVVLDRLVARQPSEYQFRALWHGIGKPALRDEGLRLEQEGPSLWIQLAAGPELRLYNDTALGSNWGGYPHAKPVVRSLSAIATVELQEGESYLFASALHGKPKGSPPPWDLEFARDGDALIARTSDGPIVVGLPTSRIPTPDGPLITDAQVTVADVRGLSLLQATKAKAGGTVHHETKEPKSVDIALPWVGDAIASVPTSPPLANLRPATSDGAHTVLWQKTLTTKMQATTQTKDRGKRRGDEPCHITGLAVARPDGANKEPYLLVATKEGPLFALYTDGNVHWTQDLGCRINDVTADDLSGDGIDEIVVGGQDHRVRVLDAAGEELWTQEIHYYRKAPYVNVVRTGDITGDGVPEVVVGGENWRFYAFTADGKELWHYESVHPSRSGAVADLDGDGKAEVLCGTHYYYFSALNPNGTRRWRHHFGPICYDVATGSFDGDETRGVVCGGGDGCIHYLAHDGKLRMQYNTGDEVRCVLAADLDRDGRDEIVAGSLSHNVYGFDAAGKRRWRVDLGAPVSALTATRGDASMRVVAGTSSGRLVTIDANGTLVASSQLDRDVVDLAAVGEVVVAATEGGALVAVK